MSTVRYMDIFICVIASLKIKEVGTKFCIPSSMLKINKCQLSLRWRACAVGNSEPGVKVNNDNERHEMARLQSLNKVLFYRFLLRINCEVREVRPGI